MDPAAETYVNDLDVDDGPASASASAAAGVGGVASIVFRTVTAESRFIDSYVARCSSFVLSGLDAAPDPVRPMASALAIPNTSPSRTACLYPPSSRRMPRVCTTADDDATRSAYDAGSNADARCHFTRCTHLGVWPAGVVYALPDELGNVRWWPEDKGITYLMDATSQPRLTAALHTAEPEGQHDRSRRYRMRPTEVSVSANNQQARDGHGW